MYVWWDYKKKKWGKILFAFRFVTYGVVKVIFILAFISILVIYLMYYGIMGTYKVFWNDVQNKDVFNHILVENKNGNGRKFVKTR